MLIIVGPCTEGPSAANCFTEGFNPARTAILLTKERLPLLRDGDAGAAFQVKARVRVRSALAVY